MSIKIIVELSNNVFNLADDQKVKKEYTLPATADYKMKVSVKEYYEGDSETPKTLTGTADAQDVKFIFPEEKKNKLQDGGIEIRYSKIKMEKKLN